MVSGQTLYKSLLLTRHGVFWISRSKIVLFVYLLCEKYRQTHPQSLQNSLLLYEMNTNKWQILIYFNYKNESKEKSPQPNYETVGSVCSLEIIDLNSLGMQGSIRVLVGVGVLCVVTFPFPSKCPWARRRAQTYSVLLWLNLPLSLKDTDESQLWYLWRR